MELPKVIVTSSRSLYSEYFLHHSCRFISIAIELTLAVIPLLYRIGHSNQIIQFFGSVLIVESGPRSRFLMKKKFSKKIQIFREKNTHFLSLCLPDPQTQLIRIWTESLLYSWLPFIPVREKSKYRKLSK
jgi:hypothetical protein